MEKVKILHVLEKFTTGGVERFIIDLVTHYDKNKYEMAVLSLSPKSGDFIFDKELERNDVRILFMESQDGKLGGFLRFIRINKIIRDFKPDIIHSHMYSLRYCMLPAILNRIPVRIHTVHVDGLLETNYIGNRLKGKFFKAFKLLKGKAPHRVKKLIGEINGGDPAANTYKGICFNKNSKIYKAININEFTEQACTGSRLMDIAFRYFNFIPVAVSENVKESIMKVFELENIHMIYNGVDISRFSPGMDQRDDREIRLINVARFEQAKNQEMLLDSFEMVVKECKNVKLLLVGDGEYRQKIMKKAVRMNLTDYVEFLGIRSDVPALFASSDIFAFPSITEAFGLVLVEAMASGLPIVSTTIGAVPEVVMNGISGILVEPNNPEAFAEAIIRLVKNKTLRDEMARNAAQSAGRFELKKMIINYENLYGELYERHHCKKASAAVK
ncbi:glycosyltransferase [Pseudobacteroides cellulosolvens]|uniref:Glycosyl transferase group 1 n=1 Tax=Pseudobacteroides cellulosolvens ATCC 35603 = DSM 2933 TaxID=398512 RepID=A0A0L6JLZ9_9FIRM|nr:glycosyltransferase [Pseudobacteroides cellulosolvens]KNY26432.1 glycosyl transferase group 1 [Pseudobacteroides cellulosolvens ATCC 35603 = DSM 2933]